MIIDCFTFYNELELLEIRLEELKGVVDWFVLVEAQQTFSGKPRDYVFEPQRKRFEHYPILYVKIPCFPTVLTSSWQREEYSRNQIAEGLQSLKPAPSDVVLLSDIDEIPRAEAVDLYGHALEADPTTTCRIYCHTLYYYYFNCQTNQVVHGTRMARYEEITTLQALRAAAGVLVSGEELSSLQSSGSTTGELVPSVGWHFSYLGGPDRVRDKIGAFSHTELDIPPYNEPEHVISCLAELKDLYGREMGLRVVPLDESFPRYLLENLERFQNLLSPE